MKTHHIPLESFIPKGKIKVNIENGEYQIPADGSRPGKGWHHTYIPGKFTLPFRVDMTVKTTGQRTYPGIEFRWYIGNGSIHWSGDHTRRTDIVTGEKTPNHQYDKDIPANEFVDISLTYGSDIMWIAINGDYCFSTYKMPYIEVLRESGVPDEFEKGFTITVSNNMVTTLTIKSLTITEYEEEEPDIPAEISDVAELSPFEWYVKGLPPDLQTDVVAIDDYLLSGTKTGLKFRRSLDENGNVLYKSSKGFVLTLGRFGVGGVQEEERHNDVVGMVVRWKPELTGKLVSSLTESSPELAKTIFSNLKACNNTACKSNVSIAYKDESKQTCSGKILFKWLSSDFDHVKKVVVAASEVMKDMRTTQS